MIGSNRISSLSKGIRLKKPEHGRQWMICEGFQFILRNQADALLQLGVCPAFKDEVLCQMWRLYLQKSRQAFTNTPVRSVKFKVIFVSVNCLSTDFSPQKGVRGQPLNLQIDTYVCGNHGDRLVHRAVSQVKVFCDKGAERKIRDEDRKRSRRRGKGLDATAMHEKEPLSYVDFTVFTPLSDLNTQPVLFIPDGLNSAQRHVGLSEEAEQSSGQKRLLFHSGLSDSAKRLRREETQRVLLYVRKESEEVFDALMLRTPTLSGLLEAVTEKYELPPERIGKVYKRCKKGMLVNMDDNIIRNYSNEDTFHLHMEEAGGRVLLTLTEI
ncbi:TATA box-binding protein-associated factor RNA polymerase I subunit B [Centroberyx gerrardi]